MTPSNHNGHNIINFFGCSRFATNTFGYSDADMRNHREVEIRFIAEENHVEKLCIENRNCWVIWTLYIERRCKSRPNYYDCFAFYIFWLFATLLLTEAIFFALLTYFVMMYSNPSIYVVVGSKQRRHKSKRRKSNFILLILQSTYYFNKELKNVIWIYSNPSKYVVVGSKKKGNVSNDDANWN